MTSLPRDASLLEERIGYTFRDKKLLMTALSHSSYINEAKDDDAESNERLEFLGDTVISIVTSRYIYFTYPDFREDRLSALRRDIIESDSLSKFASEIGLGDYLLLGNGEEQRGGRNLRKILEDAFEALTAAVYIDGGMEKASAFLMPFITRETGRITEDKRFYDPKTLLQQIVQRDPDSSLVYTITGESGPDHKKLFECEVSVDGNVMGKGTGCSKKEAEKNAAASALGYFPDELKN